MSKLPRVAPATVQHRRAVEVRWVREAEEVFVLALTHEYGGCFTHFTSKPVYCPGEKACTSTLHKKEQIWKGYFPALFWDPETKLYLPCVFELTENSELAVRGVLARGQVWRFWKSNDGRGKRESVEAELVEERPEEGLPEPFDVLQVLRRRFHHWPIRLNTVNPIPARLVLEPLTAAAPPKFQAQPTKAVPVNQGKQKTFKELRDELAARNGTAPTK